MLKPLRIRDFIVDSDQWLYAVAAYDNESAAGCLLRYIPDPAGDRVGPDGIRYRKVGFEEAFRLVQEMKPAYHGLVHRIPSSGISRVLKPDEQITAIAARDERVRELVRILDLPPGSFGVTGSMLCGLDDQSSDIDGVVYGNWFSLAQQRLRKGIEAGTIEGLDDDLWKTVYHKRVPDISFDEFIIHEQRKWNRGQIHGTYFDLLYSRGYEDLPGPLMEKGIVVRRDTIEAVVTDDTFAYDSPSFLGIDHPEISRILSFTHTYTGQAQRGERIEAKGVIEQHGSERWLIVGTTREAAGESIRSLTLLEEEL